jgi:bacillithiol biosynthesis cysteine-adding enzyme BshC
VLAELKSVLGTSEAATGVFQMVEQAYADQKNLAMATRAFVHGLLGHFGLVILDPDEVSLKQRFVPTMEMDLVQSPSQALVDTGIAALAALGYEAQVKPREINLFYMHESVRARIEKSADGMEYTVVGTALRFPATEMLVELKSHPERFSPNVVLRPLYQQQILPNIAYVGGPGELAYWLEYKALFEAYKTFFPVLVPRNFVMWIDAATNSKMNKFALSVSDLSRSLPELEKEFMQGKMGAEVKLEEEGNAMQQLYQDIIRKVSTTDATLKALAEAELQKALNGLKTMEAKMARAEKQKHETALAQIKTLKEKLFPGGTLQERADNFLPLYLKHGVSFLETLKSNLDPFQNDLIVLREQD